MPKLPTLTPQKVIKLLEKEGFVFERSKGSHHLYYNPVTGKRAVIPVHKKPLPKGTLMAILREAGITKADLNK